MELGKNKREELLVLSVAIVTPFLKCGSLDLDSLNNLVEFLNVNGINEIVVAGTTGEGILLSSEEKKIISNQIKKNYPNICLTGCYTGINVYEFDLSIYESCDNILVSPQIFIKPDIESKYDYISKICKIAKNKNIYLYNNPSRFSTNIDENLYKSLYEIENIKGVKEAGSIIDINMFPKWLWLGGNDDCLNKFHSMNFNGMVSALGNIMPSQLIECWNNPNNDWENAANIVFSSPSPLSIKYILCKLGIIKHCKTRFHLKISDKLEQMYQKVKKYVVK